MAATGPSAFLDDVMREWLLANISHRPIATRHESYAVILEELDEYWTEVKRREPSMSNMYIELKQIAAMCMRSAVDLQLATYLKEGT